LHLHELGWSPHFEAAFPAAPGLEPARVAEEHRGLYNLWTEAGEVRGRLSGRFRHLNGPAHDEYPAVGDWVVLRDGGIVEDVLPRLSALKRKRAFRSTSAQVIAANLDTVFIVTSLNADLNPRRLERYLAMVWDSGAQPVVVLSKSDLCDATAQRQAETEAVTVGVAVHALCAIEGRGMDQLEPYVRPGRTVALVGSSGVGKSTIINTLAGETLQKVKEIRRDAYRGQHTTTSRQLVRLRDGALLVDTPGMRELGLHDGNAGIGGAFADIEELATTCRFRDCRHRGEPGCSIRAALGDGSLDEDRWESYAKLKRELAYMVRASRQREILENRRARHRRGG
jgi:ribosome biogenesis GTPase